MKRLASIFLLLALASSIFAGTPLHWGTMESNMANMPCCKAAKLKTSVTKASTAKLCCALNCTTPSPTAPSSSQMNFSPLLIIAAVHPAAILRKSLQLESDDLRFFDRETSFKQIQPKYIQNHSFLI